MDMVDMRLLIFYELESLFCGYECDLFFWGGEEDEEIWEMFEDV